MEWKWWSLAIILVTDNHLFQSEKQQMDAAEQKLNPIPKSIVLHWFKLRSIICQCFLETPSTLQLQEGKREITKIWCYSLADNVADTACKMCRIPCSDIDYWRPLIAAGLLILITIKIPNVFCQLMSQTAIQRCLNVHWTGFLSLSIEKSNTFPLMTHHGWNKKKPTLRGQA